MISIINHNKNLPKLLDETFGHNRNISKVAAHGHLKQKVQTVLFTMNYVFNICLYVNLLNDPPNKPNVPTFQIKVIIFTV